jgi:hypothetical protein
MTVKSFSECVKDSSMQILVHLLHQSRNESQAINWNNIVGNTRVYDLSLFLIRGLDLSLGTNIVCCVNFSRICELYNWMAYAYIVVECECEVHYQSWVFYSLSIFWSREENIPTHTIEITFNCFVKLQLPQNLLLHMKGKYSLLKVITNNINTM